MSSKICRASVVILLIVAGIMALFPEEICAGGCDTLLGKIDDIRDAETEVAFVHASNICRAEIKAGQDLFNFYEDGCNGCYCVEGINTNTVTVWETFERNSLQCNCKDMSHVSFFTSPTGISLLGFKTNNTSGVALFILIVMVVVAMGILFTKKGGE